MSVVKAKYFYLGQEGHKRMNCAQAVMSAFQKSHRISEKQIESFSAYGGGQAPNGICGAYYAATAILKDKIEILEKLFVEEAGSVKCREIRAGKRLSCVGCVEHCARIIEDLTINKKE